MDLPKIILKNDVCEFIPLCQGMADIYDIIQVKELYDLRGNEETSLLLNVTPRMPLRNFIKAIYDRANIWSNEDRNVYVAKQRDGIVLGLVSIQPVRFPGVMGKIDYVTDVLLSEPEQINGLRNLFSKAYHHNVRSSINVKGNIPDNFLIPMQNEKFELFTRVPDRNKNSCHSEIRPAFLSNLSSIMPIQINSIGSDFCVRKLDVSDVSGKMIYSLIENNRSDAEQFLPGISKKCTSPETTTAYLMENNDHRRNNMELYYGLFASDKLVGLFDCPVQSLSVKVNMLVDKAARGKGYASEALRLLEREFFKRGIQEIWIDSHIHNYRTQTVLSQNKYICEIYDESEPFIEYHKNLTDYINGHYANETLLNKQQVQQPQKVQAASMKCPTVNYARECRS